MTIKLDMLRTFAAVAQTGTLAQAADRLGRTPSAVSMVLKSLETHLGQKLFEGERKNRLTPLGAQVLELTQEQLRQFDGTIRAIETLAQAQYGVVRAAAVPSVAAMIFPEVLRQFRDAFPRIEVELRDADSASVAAALSAGRVDIGIASLPHGIRQADQHLLFRDPFGVICAQTHPLARQPDAPTPAEIAAAGFISNDLCQQLPDDVHRTLTQGTPMLAQNTLTLMSLVRSGEVVTILPQRVIGLDPTGLTFRPVQGVDTTRTVQLFIRQSPPPPAHVRRFAELIQRQVATQETR